jgi:amino acid adenylation domain-containing protein
MLSHEDLRRKATLSADDFELFAHLLEEEGIETGAPSTITPRNSGDEVELSFAQQRLWFIDQLEPGKATYNIPFAVRLNGRLDVAALERTITEIVRRHEVLRTTFITSADGTPRQRIAAPGPYKLTIEDLSDMPASDREPEALRVATLESQAPFDLKEGPLLRVKLVRLGDDDHIVLVTLHHIISDGWSTGIFMREVATLYEAYRNGRQSALPDLQVQYADFALWQREWMSEEVLEEQLSYWRTQLGAEQAALDLPTDRPRPAVQTFRGARQKFQLHAGVKEQLLKLGREEGATLFMTLLAAWQVLLHRYTGAASVPVGTPIAGRTRTEVEGLIGFFVNTLVLRTEVDGAESFRQLLRRVREVALGAFAHQDLPFEKLVEELHPARDASHTPLFQVWFVLQNAVVGPTQFPGLTFTPVVVDSGIAQFDLSLDISEAPQGMSGTLMYNVDLFNESTISRLITHFQNLLDSILAEPDQPVAGLSLLSPYETRKLLHEWNETHSEVADDRCVHELFEEQVRRTPEAIAVSMGERSFSYAELNARANQLGHYLRELGVGPETLVGLCLKRSVEMVVGILGILKAGGSYVPLDPGYPLDHLAGILLNGQVGVLLTEEALEDRLPAGVAQVILVDADWEIIAHQPETNVTSAMSAANLAYVIHTSGSTGKPKGVMISHGSLNNYLQWAIPEYEVAGGKGSVLHSSIAFDLTITSLFPALLTGRRVVLAEEAAGVAGLFQTLLSEGGHSLIKITPAHLDLLRLELPAERLNELTKALVVGGEALTWQSVRPWREHAPRTRIINEYGPTETVVGCCVYEVEATDSESGRVPIGRPIDNTQLFILDQQKRPVPIGVRGELHIGGAGVARGYLHLPDETAQKFIPDPFSGAEGGRLYTTGDWARYLPDGQIEYLGRTDDQVKLRGYRIELGEVQAALEAHPEVRESVVLVREDSPGDKRLVGYVVLKSGDATTVPELLRFLRGKLPDYEVPARLMFLDELPLTINGKVDHAALPVPTFVRESEHEAVAPQTEIQRSLAAVWVEVLRIDEPGIYDNFFDLGGHSLLAVQVISRIREVFQVELTVRDLFESPTIGELAEAVERAAAGGQSLTSVIKRVSRDEPLPVSFAQQRVWFQQQLDPANPAYNIPAALRMVGRLNVAALERSLNEMVRRHETLRTVFEIIDGQLVQVIQPAEPLDVNLVDLCDLPDTEREQAALCHAMQEAQGPFDLERGPLLRISLLRLAGEEHVALVTLHHIISDGWSTGVFMREVAALYEAFSNGKESPLPELEVQYADFSVWQREWLSGEVLEEQLTYWRNQLGGDMSPLNLPIDKPRPPVQGFRGARQQFEIPARVREQLQALWRDEGATSFMLLLAAYNVLLHRYTGAQGVSVGTPIAGRTRTEIEKLIGFFVNTLVMRTELNGKESFRDLLRRVREEVLTAFAHQDLPFEKLVEELQPARDASRAPLAQVFFTMENPAFEPLKLTGLTLTTLAPDDSAVKYDLNLNIIDTGDRLVGSLEYKVDLFNGETIARMIENFQTLLNGIGENPDATISTLPLLAENEQQLLAEWNDTKTDYGSEKNIYQLFEEQVERSPDAVAVRYETYQLTYAQLNRRANQFAHYLRSLGVRADSRVGVMLERSFELVVSLMGILKAGAAYVPLDPGYPQERLSFMLKDADVQVLLTETHLTEGFATEQGSIVYVDQEWRTISGHSTENPVCDVTGDNLAYVIYTSGSTGKPKGAMNTHAAMFNRLCWMQETYRLTPADRILQKTAVSFDVSVWEFFWPLMTGASLVLARPGGHRDTAYMIDLIKQEKITTVHFVPPMLQVFLAEKGVKECSSLRRVFCGGETLSRELHDRFFALLSNAALYNLYGPTEAAIDVTSWICDPLSHHSIVPIGRALANTQIHLLDDYQHPVPVGVPGELYIGGIQLARGYHDRAELTAERFVPDSLSNVPGARLYRTGDRARYLSDGNIEYLGRLDYQIKIRGFRIELGEIEAVLSAHPAVREAVVLAREELGEKRLLAYLLLQGEERPSNTELYDALKAQLPDYMIPAQFVMLDEWPLTPSGKVDRKALPAPPDTTREVDLDFIVPSTGSEKEIVAIWKEVLQVDRVGVYDNFFELGGHSLLLIQVRVKLEEKFQRHIAIADLFKYPTVNALANLLDQREEKNITPAPLKPRTRRADTRQRQSRLDRRAAKTIREAHHD